MKNWIFGVVALVCAGSGASCASSSSGQTLEVPNTVIAANPDAYADASQGASETPGTAGSNGGSVAGESFGAGQEAAAATAAPSYLGSPLCNALPGNSICYPDEIPSNPTTAQDCHAAPDGGPYNPDGGYADASLSCHVVGGDGGPQTECLPSGPSLEGAPCHLSTDCAVGDECVGSPGICRHYCCSGVSACSETEFCDIRPKSEDPMIQVPVCIPLRPCGLLGQWSDAGACPAMETCVVARADIGATSCAPVGPAGEGESCATEHCAGGLVCLGEMTCFKLCHTAMPTECSSSQICKAALPVFPSPIVGVCEVPSEGGY